MGDKMRRLPANNRLRLAPGRLFRLFFFLACLLTAARYPITAHRCLLTAAC
jgi:hypothetical protein